MKEIKLRLDDEPIKKLEEPTIGTLTPIGSSNDPTEIQRLAAYANRIATIGRGFNKMHAPLYIQDFSIAYDIASNMMYEAMCKDMQADSALKVAESIAYLENAKEYLDAHSIKDTSEARKQYVPIDPEVRTAADRKAQTTAVVSFLKHQLIQFKMAIESTKKIAYGDMFMSPEEGM